MPKFKIGDKCRVIKNALAPECIGNIVEITDVIQIKSRTYYRVLEDEVTGLASEGCLELMD